MNAANNQSSTVTWTDIASNPKFQSADPETRQKIRDAFANEVVIPGAPESLRSEVRDKFMSATQADVLGRDGSPAPDKWASVRDSEAFQEAGWPERQRMRGEFYDNQVRPGVPRDLAEPVRDRFMNLTEADVFGREATGTQPDAFPQQGAAPEEGNEEAGFWQAAGNAARGAGDRAMDLAGNALQYLANSGEWREEAFRDVPVLNAAVDYANPDWLNDALRSVGQDLEDGDAGYEQQYTWERLKADPTPENLLGYIGEQGVRSVPDMAAALTLMPAYLVARSQEIGEDRQANNGVDVENGRLTAGQYAQGVPAAALSALLERIGAKGVVGIGQRPVRGAGGVARAALGGAAREAGTEFAQENIEYAGTNLGTAAGYRLEEGLDRGFAGAVAGAGVGGGIRLGTATAEAVRGPRESDQGERQSQAPGGQGPDANPDPLVYDNANVSQADWERAWADRTSPTDPATTGEAGAPSVLEQAGALIRTPRGELSSADRERRDALTYGEGFKALRARAEAQGLDEAVAELDQASEEISQAYEKETLIRSGAVAGDLQEVRAQLDTAAERFTQAAVLVDSQVGAAPTAADQAQETARRAQQRKDAAIAEARQQAAAAGGDALSQATAAQQAEQVADGVTRQEQAAEAPQRAEEISARLLNSQTRADELEGLGLGDQQSQVRLRNMRSFMNRAEAAYAKGDLDQAERNLGQADRISNAMASSLGQAGAGITSRPDPASLPPRGAQGTDPVRQAPPAGIAPQAASQAEYGRGQNQQAANSRAEPAVAPSPRVRANGQPFASERGVQMSKAYRDAVNAGLNPQVVPVADGFGFQMPNPEGVTPQAPDATAVIEDAEASPQPVVPGGDLRLRSNGQPFATESEARLSRYYREAPGAMVVPVTGGFGVRAPSSRTDAQPAPRVATPQQRPAQDAGGSATQQQEPPYVPPKTLPADALLDYFYRQGKENLNTPYSEYEAAGNKPRAIIDAYVEYFREQPKEEAETIQAKSGAKDKELAEAYEEGRKGEGQDRSASAPAGETEQVKSLRGATIDGEWTSFAPDSDTLGIPRSEMPQVKAEHRGALANFLKARGIDGTEAEVSARSLKPTQAEFSEAKVRKAKRHKGGDRAILVSSDGHVLDGHHQWMAKADRGESVRVIRLDAPIDQLLNEIQDFPSVEQSSGTPSPRNDAPGQLALFSLAEADPTVTPPTADEVSQALSGMAEFRDVAVIDHPRELPPQAIMAMAFQGVNPQDVRGMYYDDKLYVIAGNNTSLDQAVRAAVHEAVGHKGMRAVLGKRLEPAMFQLFRDLKKTPAGREALATVRDTYSFLDESKREDRLTLAEEVLAHYTENVPTDQRPGTWKRAVSQVRAMLRRVFPSVTWTESDVLALIEQSRGWLRRQNQSDQQSVPDAQRDAGLRSVVQGDGTEAGISVEEAQRIADEFLAGYNGNVPLKLRVAATQEELYGPNATRERVGSIKGAYHPGQGVLTLAAANLRDARDARATLAHEVLGHYGLNTFTPTEKRQVLDAILAMESDESLAPYWDHVRRHYPDAPRDVQAEEVFAYAAEQERSALGQAWDRVLSAFQRALRRTGLTNRPLSRSELHDMARAIGRGIRDGKRQQQTFPATDQDQFSRSQDDVRYSLGGGAGGGNTDFTVPDESRVDAALRRIADKMRPLKRLQQAIKDAGRTIEEEADTYLAEELFHGKAEYDLRQLRERYVEPLAEGLARSGITQQQLDEYLYARHAPERNAVIAERNPGNPEMADGGSGMTNAEAAEILDRVQQSGKQADYNRLADIVYAMTRQRREAIRDAGLEDGDAVDAWEAAYQYYVPLKGRAKDEPGRPRTGRGFEIGGRESRAALGRKSRADSPSSQVIVDATGSIIRVRKNEVGNALLSMVSDHPNRDLWEVFTDEHPDTQRAEVRVKDPVTGRIRIEAQERPVNMAGNQAYFKTKKAGRTYYIKIHDERLMNAMRNIGPEAGDLVTKVIGPVTRTLASLVTSYNPEFMLTNFARDVQTALLNLTAEQTRDDGKIRGERIVAQAAKDISPAMKAAWRGLSGKTGRNAKAREWDRWFREFQADGAKTGYFDMKDVQGQAKEIEAMMKQAAGGTKGNLLRFKAKTGEFVENMNGAVENAVRLSAYTNARRAGISRKQAASLAKNMTVNFNRRGEVGTTLNALYMFANASIQGTANFARTMITLKAAPEDGSRNPWARMNTAQKLAMGMATGAFALGMLNRWLSDEDDDGVLFYDKVQAHIKERNLILMTGWATGNPEDYINLPLPYGYNMFAVAGTYAEAVVNDGIEPLVAAKNMALTLVGSFSPIGFEDSDDTSHLLMKNLTPTLARSLTQIGINEKFSGGPIYKENSGYGTPKPDSALSFRSTPEAYQDIAAFLNELTGGSEYRSGWVDVSPDVLQHLVNFYGGGAWGFVEKTADYAKRKVAGEEVDRYRVPFAGRFMGSVSSYGDTQDFYERRNELGQIYEEATNTRGEEGVAYRKAHREHMRLFNRAKDITKWLSTMRRMKDRIEASDSLSEEERKRRVKQIEERMRSRVDDFNRAYNELEDRGEPAPGMASAG